MKKMLSETGHNRELEDQLKVHISDSLTDIKTHAKLFETLLYSFPSTGYRLV